MENRQFSAKVSGYLLLLLLLVNLACGPGKPHPEAFSTSDAEELRAEMLKIIAEAKAAGTERYLNIRGIFHDALLRTDWPLNMPKTVTYNPGDNNGNYIINGIEILDAPTLAAIAQIRYPQFLNKGARSPALYSLLEITIPFQSSLSKQDLYEEVDEIKNTWTRVDREEPLVENLDWYDTSFTENMTMAELNKFKNELREKIRQRLQKVLDYHRADNIVLIEDAEADSKFIFSGNDFQFIMFRHQLLLLGGKILGASYKTNASFSRSFFAYHPNKKPIDADELQKQLQEQKVGSAAEAQHLLSDLLKQQGFKHITYLPKAEAGPGVLTLVYEAGELKSVQAITENPKGLTATFPPMWCQFFYVPKQPIPARSAQLLTLSFIDQLKGLPAAATLDENIKLAQNAAVAAAARIGITEMEAVTAPSPDDYTFCFGVLGHRAYFNLIEPHANP